MMMKKLVSAVALTVALAAPSFAATLNGTFTVTVVNAKNQTSAQSEATFANYTAAGANALNGVEGYSFDSFTYTGNIDFASFGGATTIAGWLASAVGGTVDGLSSIGDALLSKGSIGNGTATTTFFAFGMNTLLGPTDFTITHDDGVAVFDLDAGVDLVGGSVGPNSVLTTNVSGFNGGRLGILYVATNSDPSILKVDVAAVPVPAAGFLLIGALGGLAALRRRKAA
jgi:hypothetical protein